MKNDKPIINLKALIITAVAIIMLILGISLYFIIDEASRNVTIRFMVAPSSAEITLNSTSYQPAKDYKIQPGDYVLTIKKAGFETYEETLNITENETLNINISLEVLPGNENYYKEHPDEAYALETIWTSQMIEGNEIVQETNPLVSILPIDVEYYINKKQYIHYQISFRIDNPENVTILINDYTGDNEAVALERIRTEGYNPDDYNIEYRDLSIQYTGTENF